MNKEMIIEHINDKIENYKAMNNIMRGDPLVQHGEGAVSALESLLHELDERDWYDE